MHWFRHLLEPDPVQRSAPATALSLLLAAWETDAEGICPRTRRTYAAHLRALLPLNGIRVITRVDLMHLATRISTAPRSAVWKRQRLAALRHFLRWAIGTDHAPRLTLTDLELLRLPPGPRHKCAPLAPSDGRSTRATDHLYRLFGRGTTSRNRALVALALELGWSPRRLVELNREDVACGQVAGRAVSAQTWQELDACLRQSATGPQTPDAPVFRSRKGNRRLSESQARLVLQQGGQRIGLHLPVSRAVRQHRRAHQAEGGITRPPPTTR